jgi:uncharacterized protein
VLRSEHVMARLYRGRLVPHRLSPDDPRVLAVAEELCDLYAAHVGLTRSRLERELTVREEGLGPALDSRRGFKIVRALSKLLEERAGWSAPTEADPYTLRTRVFELASALPEPPAAEAGLLEVPTRGDVLSQVAVETGVEDPAASSATSTGLRRESSSVATTLPRYRGCSTRRGSSSSNLVKGLTRGSCSTT